MSGVDGKRRHLLFLKQLEEDGIHVQMKQTDKELLQIQDDLQMAIMMDMMSEEDQTPSGEKQPMLTEQEKLDRYFYQLKYSFTQAPSAKLIDSHKPKNSHNNSIHDCSRQYSTQMYTPMSNLTQNYGRG
mmetsp:Transcript_5135/g.4713  ORF Transcript_5135/g.4713 Transcript_5135/m.4713 type:complete len:129 (+) Transcript_5135:616-1002(+)